MEFKIVRAIDGQVMMITSHESCIYSDATIRNMMKAGYKAYKDGKVYRPAAEGRGRKNASGRG